MIKQNKDDRYDYDLTEERRELDREGINDKKELESINVLESCINSKVEMKHHDSTMSTGNLCIEYMIDKKGDGQYVPSGISKTEADMYFLNIGVGGLFLPVEFIKYVCRRHKRFKLKEKPPRNASKYKSKNFLIPMSQLPYLLGFYQKEILKKNLSYK